MRKDLLALILLGMIFGICLTLFVFIGTKVVEVAPPPRTVLEEEDHPAVDMQWEALWKNSKNNNLIIKLCLEFHPCNYDENAEVYIVDRKVKHTIARLDLQRARTERSLKKDSGIIFPPSGQNTYLHKDFEINLGEELLKFSSPPFPTSKILVVGDDGKEIKPLKVETKTLLFHSLQD